MTLWIGERPLILASRSGSRQALLRGAGIPFDARPAEVDERAVQTRSGLTDPAAIAALLARTKALHVSAQNPEHVVLGADQTLAVGDKLFSKPSGRDQAKSQLCALAGRTHELHSAFALVRGGRILSEHVAVARMHMRTMSGRMIDTYLDAAGDAVQTSVGAYQLEGLGVHLFEAIDGDHFTILGLPLLPLLSSLRRLCLVAE